MKKNVLLLSIVLFLSCHSQEKISLTKMNNDLLKQNLVPFNSSYLDSIENKGMKDALSKYRLLGTKSCNINPDKKYYNIYIEDGFDDEQGFYNGIIIVDNKNICEVTTSPYKLRMDSLSYTKKIEEGSFALFTKKISIEDFKNKYLDEYFRYNLVTQDKVIGFEKCLAIDEYTPKSIVHTRNYYFAGKDIKIYKVPIKYNEIKNGIEGLPYFKEDKKKEFIECINKLNILKISMDN
ncbi:hypothetical protein EGY05_11070 [Chryseobacterium arthrosphaerae]|uniref:hypothetical protein n=1 Tax=Chryseobacterium arthrosphaerae TaxID=651561 RepID=UPI000F4FA1D3|nr:hypothetical protein [Chryseobacterium arthrosphaerae]AYZ12432.1 hypothetical protein EGY05_11070 [Chryseobacterium arthrosphaerae]QUY57846.1 hypothetical protein I2F65_11115 [Chryseobacterium arthrosphaerae]